MRRVVLDLHSTRPVWRAPEDTADGVRAAFGRGFEVVSVEAPAVSDGDGGPGSPEAVQAAAGAEVYVGFGVPRGVAQAAGGALRWAHSANVGVGASLTPEFLATGARLTNSRGILAEPMADWAIAAITLSARGFLVAIAAQREGRWVKDQFTDGARPIRELRGVRVGLIGLGGIGAAVAHRCLSLGLEVRAVRRRPRLRRPRGVTWVGGPTRRDLLRLAQQSDVLVVTAAQTQATRAMVDDSVFRALPPGAYVINLSRGSLLDEAALLSHLGRGHLGGCVLDVFAVEPLPPDHPFWRHPRVLVTPHVSAVSDGFWSRQTGLLMENVRRYRRGARLLNVVDLEAGY